MINSHPLLTAAKRFLIVLGIPVVALNFQVNTPLVARAETASTDSTAEVVPGTVIIKFKDSADQGARNRVLTNNGLAKKSQVWGSDAVVAQGKGKRTEALIKALSNNPFVEYVEPDYVVKVAFTPNDPAFSQQWGPKRVSAERAWAVNRGSSNVLIAVIDSGVQLNHPDLSAKVRSDIDYDFVNNDADASDDNGHGTHVAGILAATTNNSTGMAGICAGCTILPIKVIDASGSGSHSAIASGIRYAVDRGARVINLSVGGGSPSTTLLNAVQYAHSRGAVLACAAGNSNTSRLSYPAAYNECIAVAATDPNDNKASFSNFGSWVNTSAPGASIVSTYVNSSYASLNGTSMATPHVAGLAGLLFSQGRTPSDVRARLTHSTFTDAVNSTQIPRRINAAKAVGL